MVHRISVKIFNVLKKNGAVKEKQDAIVLFGIEQGITSILEIIMLLATGISMHMLLYSIFILVAFTTVRVYAGGYHAKTVGMCVIKSWLLFVSALLLVKMFPHIIGMQVIFLALMLLFIIKVSPIETKNKPLKDFEIVRYRRKAIKYYLLWMLVYVMGEILHVMYITQGILAGMYMLFVVMVAGILFKE